MSLVEAIGDFDFSGPRASEPPFPLIIFNRFPPPTLFYIFGNYGQFPFGKFIESYDLHQIIAGCIFVIDWDFIEDSDYLDCFNRYRDELHQVWVDAPYIITLTSASEFTQASARLRKILEIPPDIPIVEFDNTPQGAGRVFTAFFKRQTKYTQEELQLLFDALAKMAHK